MAELSDKTWDATGRAEFIAACKKASDDENELRQLLIDAVRSVSRGKLRPESLANSLTEVVTTTKDGPTVLVDVCLLCDMETNATEIKEHRERFLWFLGAISNRVVSDSLLKERLDFETSGDAHILPDKKSASTKFIKLKTRIFYKQHKYNLLREEGEGYAKLITELTQEGKFDIDYMLNVIRSLIGCFNLDPNRVLDIILECFENRPSHEESYVNLIRRFFDSSKTISELLAFKFRFYQGDEEAITPDSLYLVTALILSNQLVSLGEIYPYLTPTDAQVIEFAANELADARAIAKRATIISTAAEKPKEERLSPLEKHSLVYNNQKLGLCGALLKVGNWNDANQLIHMLPEYYAVHNEDIASRLATLINVGIDKLYKEHSGLPPVIESKLRSYRAKHVRYLRPAESIADLKQLVFPMISTLGAFMYADPLLIAKLIRLVRSLLIKHPEMKGEVLNIVEESILPALSLVVSNSGLCEELWGLLKLLPYENRYRLYSSWKQDSNNPVLIKVRADTLKDIKQVMKRLSKENVKMYGRRIGKLSHSNPSFLFDYILSQIQSYDNLIGPVVDSLKFLNSVSYDVLVFSVIESLADPKKDRTKHDGASISPWLLSLANFCGAVVKKYSVELPGLLQFIANQLKAERGLDLLILKEIVNKMAGIEAMEEMTNDQLSALTGGELLRAEGGYFNQVRNTRKSSLRLKESLLENDMAMPMCILMAQQRSCILFNVQEHSHLKLVGKLYDQCQETLVQYGSFLSTSLSIDDYVKSLPSLENLLTEYNLSADVAFFLARPMIIHHITLKFLELRKQSSEERTDSSAAYLDAWEFATQPIVDAVIPALKTKYWDDLSPRLYVSFWMLSPYDLEVPKASYDREVDRLKALEEGKDAQAPKKKRDIERGKALQEKLLFEQVKQDEHVRRVRTRLEKEKEEWFQSNAGKAEMTTQFFQHCLFPRCIFTANDALYSAKFVHLLHTIKTPNFSTLICYDRIFGDITYTMCSCTENEANHYGRFLCAILEVVMRWHKDKKLFDVECAKFPGFVTKCTEQETVHVDYESYRHVCHKWHYRLTKAFILCLDSEDYIQIRNSLLVLLKIQPHFPVITSFAQAIDRRVENTRKNEKDKRPDLYALATGYSGVLKAKKSQFMAEGEFHIKVDPNKKPGSGAATTTVTKEPEGPVAPPSSKKKESSSTMKKEVKKEPREEKKESKRVKESSKETNGSAGNGESSDKSIRGEKRVVTSNIRIKTDPPSVSANSSKNKPSSSKGTDGSVRGERSAPRESKAPEKNDKDRKQSSQSKEKLSSDNSAKRSPSRKDDALSESKSSRDPKRRKLDSDGKDRRTEDISPVLKKIKKESSRDPSPQRSAKERGDVVDSLKSRGDVSASSSPSNNFGRSESNSKRDDKDKDKRRESRKRDISTDAGSESIKKPRTEEVKQKPSRSSRTSEDDSKKVQVESRSSRPSSSSSSSSRRTKEDRSKSPRE